MTEKVFADTNLLVYLFDADAPAKQQRAREIVGTHWAAGTLVLSTQVLQEFYVSVLHKLSRPLPQQEAEGATREFALHDVVAIDVPMVLRAIGTATRHRLALWDALIVEAAHARGCRVLLSEDLQHGREFGALRVENPFRGA